ncbi:hypothetical protein V6N13_144913 [Hibiscus sabdariffa]
MHGVLDSGILNLKRTTLRPLGLLKDPHNLICTLLVEDLLELMIRPWNIYMFHVDREKNAVADKLAALSRDNAIGESLLERPRVGFAASGHE